ncbi:prepilin-type N-terminal cleavage/methylation domain-containing protein [Myxococcus sp. K15C18031901]|uniref:type IV pilus modification PilV family protein n=1 Tax=Myxococcus dinghuensis TaxID=2906761 RepID=UPI0020A7764E|nr:prepilin-type N-terminal cleavage/methylation domain-containing protein [Myxococcus dinghuensis]MCP3102024.1 prepilin-type N-terminal cleavage/methylation domain-containing protein [Myxococcus dinghuensis]
MNAPPRSRLPRGATLVEVLVSMVILALAAAGAVAGMVFASRDVHDGQLLQVKRLLLEASTQRLWLAGKAPLLAEAVVRPNTFPTDLAPGTAPWRVDPSPAVGGDIGSGAYFKLSASGQVEPLTGISAGTACNAPTLPEGTYCREVLVTVGLPRDVPTAASALLPAGARPMTVWMRVVRKGDNAARAQSHSEVFVQ